MIRELKLICSLLKSQIDYAVLFTVVTLILILFHQLIPSDGFAQTFLIIAFVYLIMGYYGYLILIDQRKIGDFIYSLPISVNQLINADILFILISNICAYSLWSIFLIGTQRIFMMLPLIYMVSISIFTSLLIMVQKYMNTRFNLKISLIINLGIFIFFLFGYMPIQNLYDRGMLNTHAFYFTWLPIVVVIFIIIFTCWTKQYLEKNAHSKHLLWSD